jgi:hypothetical protein
LFDIIGIDHYRSAFNKSTYLKELKKYLTIGKPVSIMEFGCCTYKGAEDKGATGWAIVDWEKAKPEIKAEYTRNEEVQSKYLLELLNIFEMKKCLHLLFSLLFFTIIFIMTNESMISILLLMV